MSPKAQFRCITKIPIYQYPISETHVLQTQTQRVVVLIYDTFEFASLLLLPCIPKVGVKTRAQRGDHHPLQYIYSLVGRSLLIS